MIEKTLVLIKPDGVARSLVGEIISRFEKRGLKIIGMKMIQVDENFAKNHYTKDIAERHGEHVRTSQINFITSGPIIAMCIEGINAIQIVRKIVGSTYPDEASIGTIRGDFAHLSKAYLKKEQEKDKFKQCHNLVHASGNQEEAKIEIKLWFSIEELHKYETVHEQHIK